MPLILIILLLLPSICHADTRTGLIAWWKLDEPTGTAAINSGTLGGTLTMTASPSSVPGRVGPALSFNGTSQAMNTSSTIAPASNILTVAFWFNGSYATETLIAESSINFNNNNHTILIDTNDAGTGFLSAAIHGQNASNFRSERFAQPGAGWHHLAFIFDNSTTAGNVDLYLDGVAQSSTIQVNTKTATANFATHTWYFMSRAASSFWVNGIIDDIRIYNRELTAGDALELYNQGFYGNRINNALINNAVIQ